ncbi:MAG: hypothetical protein ACQEQF_05925 [Bacillota bacterium]
MDEEIVTFDIVTEGQCINDDFVSGAIYNGDFAYITSNLEELLDELNKQAQSRVVLTYNASRDCGISFLRSYCLKNGIEWTIQGVEYLDFAKIIKKRFNTNQYITKLPSIRTLKVPELKELAEANNIDYQNKKQCYETLLDLKDETDWLCYKQIKTNEDNSLLSVYKMFVDPQEEEKYISDREIPYLYKRYKKIKNKKDQTKEEKIEIKEIWDKIFKYNELNTVRLYKLVSLIRSTVPQHYIDKERMIL